MHFRSEFDKDLETVKALFEKHSERKYANELCLAWQNRNLRSFNPFEVDQEIID